ncbi:Digestive organ expansion factor-like protein, partial [Bienertia sinuspersici]
FRGSRTLAKCRSVGNNGKRSRRTDYEENKVSDDIYDKHVKTATSEEDDDDDEDVEEEDDEEEAEDEEEEIGLHSLGSNGRNSGMGEATSSSDDEVTDVVVDDDDIISDAEDISREDIATGLVSSSQSQSNFGIHIAHKLSTNDVENLLKRKWKYGWNMPALDSNNCTWMGTGDSLLKDVPVTAPYGLKLRLYKHWLELYNQSGGNNFQSSKQRLFFSLCDSYRDILHHHKKPFYHKGAVEDSNITDAYIMHSLNHVFRTRDHITKNDSKLSKHQETAREEVLTNDSFLDQGFTRPKVLILLPLASIAFRFVRRLIQLTPSANKVNVEYMDRFEKDFGVDVEDDEDDVEAKELKLNKPSKPSDFQALFGANNNDHFMVGIKFTRKSVRLYSDFYSSDMIVASPLGLITKIGEAETNKEKDIDYLSSIEILIVDHADVISMQNWSHVNTVVEHLNLLPSKQHGGDIMRIRRWYLDEQARFYRQTIILSSYLNPDINALFNRHCLNFEGKLRFSCDHKGVLPKVILQVKQVYERFNSDSILEVDDARLDYFIKKVFPKIKDSIQGGIMIFISSYFEFVRIRNFLKSQNAAFCLLDEYTKQSDISRARNWFIKGQRKIMLYTERAHFYHRYKIRGIQNIIIYSLPERKEFYPEILNMLEGSHDMTCTVLFSRFDQLRLERVVGSAAAKRMASSEKDLFIFK